MKSLPPKTTEGNAFVEREAFTDQNNITDINILSFITFMRATKIECGLQIKRVTMKSKKVTTPYGSMSNPIALFRLSCFEEQ